MHFQAVRREDEDGYVLVSEFKVIRWRRGEYNMPKCGNHVYLDRSQCGPIGNLTINFFWLVLYEPEKWQKLGKSPESPEAVKSYESIKSTKSVKSIILRISMKHQFYMIEQPSHTVMVASRFEEHTKIEHSTFI